MALVLRASPAERALRSADDHPGIVFVNVVSGIVAFAVDPRTPPEIREGSGGVMVPGQGHGEQTVLDLDEAIDACEGRTELLALVELIAGCTQFMAPKLASECQFEHLILLCEFGVEVRDGVHHALHDRGLLTDDDVEAGGGETS